jgi:hypothetical protein
VSQEWRYSLLVRGREVDVPEGEATLGRSRSASISLQDPSISRVHIRISARNGRVTIEDLGSANGTYVNGLRVDGAVDIGDGARLMLGESEVILRVAKAPSPAATRRIDPKEFLCVRCGRPYPEGTTFCPTCTAEASRTPPPRAPQPPGRPARAEASASAATAPATARPAPPQAAPKPAAPKPAAPKPPQSAAAQPAAPKSGPPARPARPAPPPRPAAPPPAKGLLSRLFGKS